MILLAVSTLSFQACNSSKSENNDSVENAENANDKKEDANMGQSDDTNEFAVEAANGGMMEVDLGRMAEEKGVSNDVKEFGKMMVADHSKANDELKTLATAKNITLPATIGEDKQEHVNDLAKLSGKEFDKKYVSMMLDDHQKDVDAFEKASKNDEIDADVKAFAAKTLPTLQQHLDRIKAIDKMMN